MEYAKKILFTASLVFLFCISRAQDGNFFLKHYTHTVEEADNFNFWIREDKNGIMVFANSKGLLLYDGIQWKLVKTPETPLAIETEPVTGKIYAGFRNGFGYFQKDMHGALNYVSLSHDYKNTGEVTRILKTDKDIFFCNHDRVYGINIFTDKIIEFHQEKKNKYTGFATRNNEVLVNIEGKGLHKIQNKNMSPVPGGEIFSNSEILFGLETDSGKILLGNNADEIYLFDGLRFARVGGEAEVYLKQNLLSDAALTSNKEIMLGTLAGGCILVDQTTGKITKYINSETGLPDNEVFALGKDRNGGTWIAHHYGFTRLDHHLSFRDFTHYPGLQGHLLSVLYHKDILYVSTNEGVYYLSREEEAYRAKTPPDQTGAPPLQKNKLLPKKNLNYFFDHLLFKRKISKEEKKIIASRKGQVAGESDALPVMPKSAGYVFKKIQGLNAKCKNLIPYQDVILVGSAKGLYEIRALKIYPVLQEKYIHAITTSADKKGAYIGTRHGIYFIQRKGNSWKIQTLGDEADVSAYSILEQSSGNVWIGSNGKLIHLSTDAERKLIGKRLFYLNNIHENIVIRSINGVITFFLSNQTYYYNSSKDTILEDPAWPRQQIHITVSNNQQELTWFRSDSCWVGFHCFFEKKNIRPTHLTYFRQLKDIYRDASGNLWVIDPSNHIYKADAEKSIPLNPFSIHIKEIRNKSGAPLPLSGLNLDYKNNSLDFYLAAPFYMDEKSVHFQYLLEGVSDRWSSWTSEHKIELNYLPIGDYKLRIRARNGLGQTSEIDYVEIHILPPYWKTRWFYIAIILFFFTLIVLSVLLNRSNKSSFFTKALTFLTLIILVEFIIYELETMSNLSNADSPLIRFGFNVLLALMISPIEKFLEIIISNRKRRIAKIILLLRNKSVIHKKAA